MFCWLFINKKQNIVVGHNSSQYQWLYALAVNRLKVDASCFAELRKMQHTCNITKIVHNRAGQILITLLAFSARKSYFSVSSGKNCP
jgi:hypothetical protein